jgi:hypothetical protein
LKTLNTINTITNLDNTGIQASKQFGAYVLAKQGSQKFTSSPHIEGMTKF